MSTSYRSVRVKRKPKEDDIIEEDLEADYILEKEGDVKNFLRSKYKFVCPKYDSTGEVISHSMIGPTSLFKSGVKDCQSPTKKSGTSTKKKKKAGEVDPSIRFKEILEQLSDIKHYSAQAEYKKLSSVSGRQKFPDNRQDMVIQNFQRTVRYWKNLETKLASKSKKKTKDILYTRSSSAYTSSTTPDRSFRSGGNSIENQLMWYMRLRESFDADKFETFLPVGTEQGGLYTRIQVKNTVKTPVHMKFSSEKIDSEELIHLCEEDLNALQIVGVSKLPLEIAAVDKVGCQYLKPELLDLSKDEEVIAENYDLKVKARLL